VYDFVKIMRIAAFFRRTAAVTGLGLGILLGIVGVRSALTRSRQPAFVAPTVPEFVDVGGEQAARLGQAVRFQTVSRDGSPPATAEFLQLHELLRQSFPLIHSTLQRETVGDLSLLYKWEGQDPAARPILLLAHQDVVPVEPGTESRWQKPPFSGEIDGGFIWGRGTLDDKCSVMAIFEAVEWLLLQGKKPRRTIYLAFGHDEEAVSVGGALQIAELLKSRGIQLELVLDEGLAVTRGLMPGVQRPVALIGVSEKGVLNVHIEAVGEGGHSSMPPKRTLIGQLSRAITRLEDQPMPRQLRPPTSDMFDYVAPEMSWPLKPLLTNRWLFDPVLTWQLDQGNSTRAMLRTTQAPTMLQGSPKSNVLPQSARVTVNFRIRPGDTTASVTEHVQKVVADEHIRVTAQPESATEPSPVSDPNSPTFATVGQTIVSLFPDAIVAPGLMIGASDGRHFARVADSVYRFVPFVIEPEDLARFHGTNERIRTTDYLRMIRFYAQLIQNLDAPH
jgi:carboxypeptidase PM20D1